MQNSLTEIEIVKTSKTEVPALVKNARSLFEPNESFGNSPEEKDTNIEFNKFEVD